MSLRHLQTSKLAEYFGLVSCPLRPLALSTIQYCRGFLSPAGMFLFVMKETDQTLVWDAPCTALPRRITKANLMLILKNDLVRPSHVQFSDSSFQGKNSASHQRASYQLGAR